MQVILLEKIKHLGKLGDTVNVKPGYGRNYLIPQSKAAPATPANIKAFEEKRAELEKAQLDTLDYAKRRAEQLKELTVVVASKVGLEGKLYGSVTTSDIAQALTDAGIEVSKQEVRLPGGFIRQMGDYDVSIHLHPDVDASVKVQVIAED
jgi:large subunit ribosomal protein L9